MFPPPDSAAPSGPRRGRRYTYFKGDKDREFITASMRSYVDTKQELDKLLETLIEPFIRGRSLSILDACCGIGHIPYFLSDISPASRFLGVDQTPYLIEEARKLCQLKTNITFQVADVYDLPKRYNKEFDVSISWKTVSWLPYYDHMLDTLVGLTRQHIFLSSLFYDGDMDFQIKVREFWKEAAAEGFTSFYNVYSLPRFRDFVYGLGAKDMEVHDFDLNIDLIRPPADRMGTYTVKLENGKRLQISGAVVMTWKVIRIDL